MLHIPYKGNVPAITDLLAGQTSLLFATMPTVLPHAKAGKPVSYTHLTLPTICSV